MCRNYLVSDKNHIFVWFAERVDDENHTIRLLCYQDGKLLSEATLQPSRLENDIKALIDRIPGFLYLHDRSGVSLPDMLYQKLQKGEYHVYDSVSTLGWQPDKNQVCRYASSQLLDSNGNVLFDKLGRQHPKMAGVEKDWCSLLNEWSRGHIKRQTVLAVSLAAPLAGLMKKNLLVALIGNSSTGKTTAAKLALSLFAPPDYDHTSLTFNATENALMERLNGNEGVPVLIDDTSLSNTDDFTSMIYSLANGISRLRYGQKSKHWHTSTLITAERSLLDNRRKNIDGVLARIIEMPVSGGDLFHSRGDARNIQRFYNGCHGVVGTKFVRLLLRSEMPDIDRRYEDWICRLEKQNPDSDNLVCRQIEQISLVSLAAELAQEIGLTLNAESIAQYLLDCTLDSIENDAVSGQSSKSSEELIEDKIQSILSEESDEIYPGLKGPFLPVSAGAWREFIHRSRIGAHNINRIRRQLGYFDATLTINGKTQRGFYLNKGVIK